MKPRSGVLLLNVTDLWWFHKQWQSCETPPNPQGFFYRSCFRSWSLIPYSVHLSKSITLHELTSTWSTNPFVVSINLSNFMEGWWAFQSLLCSKSLLPILTILKELCHVSPQVQNSKTSQASASAPPHIFLPNSVRYCIVTGSYGIREESCEAYVNWNKSVGFKA